MTSFAPTIAAVVIAGGKRADLIDEHIIPSLSDFDEIVVVGEHRRRESLYRYLYVPAMMGNTFDALIKRDVGTLACRSEIVAYFSDDHAALGDFAGELKQFARDAIAAWDVLVPSRWADHPEQGRIHIPNGERELYCAGHGGVFRKRVMMARPWAAQQHHRNWDLIASHEQQKAGFKFLSYPRLQIIDLEPERQPWA